MSELIKFDEKNYRLHGDKNKRIIKKSLAELGAGRSIVVDNENFIIAGNGVFEQAQELGIKTRIIESDGTELIVVKRTDIATNDEKRKLLALVDNYASDTSEFDIELIMSDFDIETLESFEFETIEYEDDSKNLPQEDNFNEQQEIEKIKTNIVLGDLIEIGNHRLFCGDSTKIESFEKVLSGKKIDCVFTSPPYNMGIICGNDYGNNKLEKLYKEKKQDNKTSGEYKNFLLSVLKNISLFLSEKNSVFWNCSYNAKSRDDYGKIIFSDENPLKVRETIIWDKLVGYANVTTNALSRTCELIFLLSTSNKYLTNQNKEVYWNVWRINSAYSQQDEHKACFPVALPTKAIIDFTKENHLIFDCFSGAGTTMLACEQNNRTFAGIELVPEYCELTIKRLLEYYS